jgi:pyruvate/oxaloacetate carboxyltransferase
VAFREKKPLGQRVPFDRARYLRYAAHQIPGGMMSHLASQLKALGLENRIPEVLEEAGRVRQEIGYPVMVTPFSQIVGVQAVFNVIQKERYKTMPSDLNLYARGFYGKMAAPIDPNVLDRILEGGEAEPIDAKAVFSEPLAREARKAAGPSCSDEQLLLTLFFSKPTLEKFRQNARPIDTAAIRTPVLALIQELLKRPGIRQAAIRKGPLKLVQTF